MNLNVYIKPFPRVIINKIFQTVYYMLIIEILLTMISIEVDAKSYFVIW